MDRLASSVCGVIACLATVAGALASPTPALPLPRELLDATVPLPLDAEERAFLAAKGPLKLCVAPDWMPMDGIDAAGHHTGMASDFLALMARRGGFTWQLVQATDWDDTWRHVQQGDCDVVSMLADTSERRKLLDFTATYLEIRGAIATSADVHYIASFEQVLDKPLGILRGVSYERSLPQYFPGIRLVPVESYEEGLRKVERGELFGMVGNAISIGSALRDAQMPDLKIAGQLDMTTTLCVGTRNDEPMLGRIFQRLVEAIGPRERQAVMNRWLPVRFEQGFDYRLFWKLLPLFLLLVGAALGWAVTLRRLNARLREANARLAETSRRDPLTGLHNRMHFDSIVGNTLSLCAREGLVMTLAMIDIDHFKQLNDRRGHPFGDACLRRVAATLAAAFRRESDNVVRYGGEEFIVLAVGGTPQEGAARLEALRADVQHDNDPIDGEIVGLTISIGLWSAVPRPEDTSMRLLQLADAALYDAKRGGRNRVVVAKSESPAPAPPASAAWAAANTNA